MFEPIKLGVSAAGARALRGTLRPLTAIQTAFMWENRGCDVSGAKCSEWTRWRTDCETDEHSSSHSGDSAVRSVIGAMVIPVKSGMQFTIFRTCTEQNETKAMSGRRVNRRQ